jgi:hypothetical protein
MISEHTKSLVRSKSAANAASVVPLNLHHVPGAEPTSLPSGDSESHALEALAIAPALDVADAAAAPAEPQLQSHHTETFYKTTSQSASEIPSACLDTDAKGESDSKSEGGTEQQQQSPLKVTSNSLAPPVSLFVAPAQHYAVSQTPQIVIPQPPPPLRVEVPPHPTPMPIRLGPAPLQQPQPQQYPPPPPHVMFNQQFPQHPQNFPSQAPPPPMINIPAIISQLHLTPSSIPPPSSFLSPSESNRPPTVSWTSDILQQLSTDPTRTAEPFRTAFRQSDSLILTAVMERNNLESIAKCLMADVTRWRDVANRYLAIVKQLERMVPSYVQVGVQMDLEEIGKFAAEVSIV